MLQLLDTVAAGFERLRPVRTGDRDHDAGLPDLELSDAVQQRHPADGPPLEHACGELLEPRDRELLPGLVREARDNLAGRPNVPNGADEHAGAAGAGVVDVRQRVLDDERLRGHADERAVGRHGGHRSARTS